MGMVVELADSEYTYDGKHMIEQPELSEVRMALDGLWLALNQAQQKIEQCKVLLAEARAKIEHDHEEDEKR